MNTERIIEIFCSERGVEKQSIYSRDSYISLYYTRYMIWHYLHYVRHYSAGRLSSMFSRTAPSIFRGIRQLRHLLTYDKEMRSQYHAIVKKIEDADNAASPAD